MDGRVISVRAVQTGVGLIYSALALLALVRLQSLMLTGMSLLLSVIGYASARALPDIQVRSEDLWRVAGVAFVLIVIGAFADARGGADALGWASVVLAYAAGNRLRGAFVGDY